MKKAVVFLSITFVATALLQAATITQQFDTGAISPGSLTESDFNVGKFNTAIGSLTAVTITIGLATWGGSYTIENTTVPSVPVNGTIHQGVSAAITGQRVPESMNEVLIAGQDASYKLTEAGKTFGLTGPTYESRNTAGPNIGYVDEANFGLYEGTGTFLIRFLSSQGNSHTADGSVKYIGTSAYSQGFMTISYDYEPVPEPASLALVGLGGLVLALRRRSGKKA